MTDDEKAQAILDYWNNNDSAVNKNMARGYCFISKNPYLMVYAGSTHGAIWHICNVSICFNRIIKKAKGKQYPAFTTLYRDGKCECGWAPEGKLLNKVLMILNMKKLKLA
jgi:hypothetical protein